VHYLYLRHIPVIFPPIFCTDFGVKVKQYVNKGHLVPDELMISLMTSELRLLENNNWILDGK
jgi:adenylate kinase family enzyme